MTRRSSAWWRVLALMCALVLVLAACGGDDDDDDDASSGDGGGDLSGEIAIDGSSTVAPLSETAAEDFMAENSGVQITVGTSGTGGGFEKFCNGETDISDASRPIHADDEAEGLACEANGITYTELQIANDGLSVVVNPENDWAELPDGRAAGDDLGTGCRRHGHELEPGRPVVPRRAARAVRSGHRLRHLRLLHRRDQR